MPFTRSIVPIGLGTGWTIQKRTPTLEILAEIPDIGSNVGLAGRADVCVSDLNSEQAEIELVDGTDFRSIDAEYTRVRVSSLA